MSSRYVPQSLMEAAMATHCTARRRASLLFALIAMQAPVPLAAQDSLPRELATLPCAGLISNPCTTPWRCETQQILLQDGIDCLVEVHYCRRECQGQVTNTPHRWMRRLGYVDVLPPAESVSIGVVSTNSHSPRYTQWWLVQHAPMSRRQLFRQSLHCSLWHLGWM